MSELTERQLAKQQLEEARKGTMSGGDRAGTDADRGASKREICRCTPNAIANRVAARMGAEFVPTQKEKAMPEGNDEVERVAQMLCDDHAAREIAGRAFAPLFDDSADDVQRYWRAIGIAALSTNPANEKVTEAMIEAGGEAWMHITVNGERYTSEGIIRAIYLAMRAASRIGGPATP